LPIDFDRWGVPIQLVERRVLHPGHWRWLRAVAWLGLVFFLTAGAFGIPLQAAVDLLPPGNAAPDFAVLLVACAAAVGCYALAVQVGEGRGESELALRPALSGLAVGAVIGLWRAFGPVPPSPYLHWSSLPCIWPTGEPSIAVSIARPGAEAWLTGGTLRPGGLGVRPAPGQLGDSGRPIAGPEDRPLGRPTAPPLPVPPSR
jgi:hypothetical protein